MPLAHPLVECGGLVAAPFLRSLGFSRSITAFFIASIKRVGRCFDNSFSDHAKSGNVARVFYKA